MFRERERQRNCVYWCQLWYTPAPIMQNTNTKRLCKDNTLWTDNQSSLTENYRCEQDCSSKSLLNLNIIFRRSRGIGGVGEKGGRRKRMQTNSNGWKWGGVGVGVDLSHLMSNRVFIGMPKIWALMLATLATKSIAVVSSWNPPAHRATQQSPSLLYHPKTNQLIELQKKKEEARQAQQGPSLLAVSSWKPLAHTATWKKQERQDKEDKYACNLSVASISCPRERLHFKESTWDTVPAWRMWTDLLVFEKSGNQRPHLVPDKHAPIPLCSQLLFQRAKALAKYIVALLHRPLPLVTHGWGVTCSHKHQRVLLKKWKRRCSKRNDWNVPTARWLLLVLQRQIHITNAKQISWLYVRSK